MRICVYVYRFLFAVFFLFFKYQICKSMQLAQALSLATLSLSLFNFFLFIPEFFLSSNMFAGPTYIAVLLLFLFPLQVLGTQFFWNEYQEVFSFAYHATMAPNVLWYHVKVPICAQLPF